MTGADALVKKMAGYHQFHAVEVAVAETLRAAELSQTNRETRRRSRLAMSRAASPVARRATGALA